MQAKKRGEKKQKKIFKKQNKIKFNEWEKRRMAKKNRLEKGNTAENQREKKVA
jgi:hypothetical protein